MAGSLSEWTSTLDRPYPYRGDDGREYPSLPGERVVRGGDYVFNSSAERLTTWNRTTWAEASVGIHAVTARAATKMMLFMMNFSVIKPPLRKHQSTVDVPQVGI
jgi:hypothetical protein